MTQGYASLGDQDYQSALSHADAYLAKTPSGAGSAEALYLRGRALEQKSAASAADARVNLKAARAAYVDALGKQPAQKLATFIHTSLGNVAYFQDDYQTAVGEWTAAYDKLENDNVKAWVLYRTGVARQRLGQFADADAAFAATVQRFPGSVPAQRAREHQGVHSFNVQLATFSSAAPADAAIVTLRQQGIGAVRQPDGRGQYVLRVGPMNTFAQASALRNRLAAPFPDAMIIP